MAIDAVVRAVIQSRLGWLDIVLPVLPVGLSLLVEVFHQFQHVTAPIFLFSFSQIILQQDQLRSLLLLLCLHLGLQILLLFSFIAGQLDMGR